MKNNLDIQYTSLLQEILDAGNIKGDRTGTGTLSLFGRTIRHNMKDGFPLLTTKKIFTKAMITELRWFLKGDTNIQYLVQNGCNIWNGDAYKNYCKWYVEKNYSEKPVSLEEFVELIKTDDEFAEAWGELGPIYGKQWRKWELPNYSNDYAYGIDVENDNYIDQLKNALDTLKNNPDSRRIMVNAWNPADIGKAVLPPCHYGFQFYTRKLTPIERYDVWFKNNYETGIEYNPLSTVDYDNDYYVPTPERALSLSWNQRSVDTFLGLPFNIASYGLLLTLVAEEVNMIPEELIGNLGDTHLYSNHLEQAKEQIGKELTIDERFKIWFTEHKPNRDTVDNFSDNTYKNEYLDSLGIPRKTREPRKLPSIKVSNVDILNGEFDVKFNGYNPHPAIKAPLSN